MKKQEGKRPPNFSTGYALLSQNQMLAPLVERCHIIVGGGDAFGRHGFCHASTTGYLFVRKDMEGKASPEEWAWMLGVLCIQIALRDDGDVLEAEGRKIALSVEARRLAKLAKIGKEPDFFLFDLSAFPNKNYAELGDWLDKSFEKPKSPPSIAGEGAHEIRFTEKSQSVWNRTPDFSKLLAEGIASAANAAVSKASGVQDRNSNANRARRWLMDHYPFLGATAALFNLVEDEQICEREDVGIAAVDGWSGEILVNPKSRLSLEESKFVIAHEILHVALGHLKRRRGRDPFLWNCACDFVVNEWLEKMAVGAPPAFGLLRDASLDGKSAEDIYDLLCAELRKSKKLICLSGRSNKGDMIERGGAASFEDVAKRALLSSYDILDEHARGLLPGGLTEEIRTLAHPPVPWDVKLAEWMTERFRPEEKEKSYARPSRRQSSSPDIPRPGRREYEESRAAKVLGVIVDTSASMDRRILGSALGAIASTCESLDVDKIRLIWCDAGPHDEGWKDPVDLWGKISVHGRGGTVLQPAFDFMRALVAKNEFPHGGPILVITDGWCEDELNAQGFDSAALIPEGAPKPRGIGAFFKMM